MAEPSTRTFWSLIGNVFQVIGLIVGIYWCFRLPAPGYAIGAVAVLATVMTLHEGMLGQEKALWTLLICGFLAIEMFAIKKDRTEFSGEFHHLVGEVESSLRNTNTLLTNTQNLLSQFGTVQATVESTNQGVSFMVTGFNDAIKKHDLETARNLLVLMQNDADLLTQQGRYCLQQTDLLTEWAGKAIFLQPTASEEETTFFRQKITMIRNNTIEWCSTVGKPMMKNADHIAQELIKQLPESKLTDLDKDDNRPTNLKASGILGAIEMQKAGAYLKELIKRVRDTLH